LAQRVLSRSSALSDMESRLREWVCGCQQPVGIQPISLRQSHLRLLKHVGNTCRDLPNCVKVLVWNFLRSPVLLQVSDAKGAVAVISMQTGKAMHPKVNTRMDDCFASFPHSLARSRYLCCRNSEMVFSDDGFKLSAEFSSPQGPFFEHRLGSPAVLHTGPPVKEHGKQLVFEAKQNRVFYNACHVMVSSDGRWAMIAKDYSVEVFDIRTGKSKVIDPMVDGLGPFYDVYLHLCEIEHLLVWAEFPGQHLAVWNCSDASAPIRLKDFSAGMPVSGYPTQLIVHLQGQASALSLCIEDTRFGWDKQEDQTCVILLSVRYKAPARVPLQEVGRVLMKATAASPVKDRLLATLEVEKGEVAVWSFKQQRTLAFERLARSFCKHQKAEQLFKIDMTDMKFATAIDDEVDFEYFPPCEPHLSVWSPGSGPQLAETLLEFASRENLQPATDEFAEVFQEVQHAEAPAIIDQEESLQVASAIWTTSVERTAGARNLQTPGYIPAEDSDVILLLHFNRTTPEMMESLTDGLPLRACRAALQDNNLEWQLSTGTLVFVHPWQHAHVLRECGSHTLTRSHVFVASSLEYLVEESILLSGIGRGTWARQRKPLDTISDYLGVNESTGVTVAMQSLNRMKFEASGDWQANDMFCVKHTFICTRQQHSSSSSEAQSAPAVL